jgi:hypothetical protein
MWAKTSRFLAVGLVFLAGCGGSKSESALHKEWTRVRAGACRSEVFNTTHCGEEMQKVCETALGSGAHEPEERHIYCEMASEIRVDLKKKELTPAHTPVEEERRKDNLEAEGKAAHEEKALEHSPGASKACEEEKRTQEKLHYENPSSPPEPQREAEYEQLCGR